MSEDNTDTREILDVVVESEGGEQRSFKIAAGYSNIVTIRGTRLEFRAIGVGEDQ